MGKHSQAMKTLDQTDDCPVTRSANLIGDKWTLLIVRDLIRGTMRFGQLQSSLGNVSPKTLSQRLKMLEAADLVSRTIYAEVPPRVEYRLTEKGTGLKGVIDALERFGNEHLPIN